MTRIKRIKISFIKLLKKISEREIENFSGLGILFYDSRFISDIPSVNLRPSIECPKGLHINDKKTFDFLLKTCQGSHPLHEGYHFFNKRGLLTHISQYLISPRISNVIPNELHGGRYLSAKLESHIKGVLWTGIVCCNHSAFYFEKGKSYELSTQWGKIYKDGEDNYKYYDLNKPHKDLKKVTVVFRENNVKKILDLGCGSGRNLVYLARKGFEMYGIDLAKEGIKSAKRVLQKQKVQAKLRTGDVFEKLPYKDNFFDAIISIQVLQHGSLNQIRGAILEIERVLKPNGLIFVTLCGRYSKGKVRYCLVKTAKKVAPRTYVPTIGKEAGLIHYIYNNQTIKKHYKRFDMLEIWRDDKDYYCFIARSKKHD